MNRRDVIIALGTVAAVPRAADAQPARLKRVGMLMGLAHNDPEGQARHHAFLEAFAKLGWRDGQNVRIETRWLNTDYSGLDGNVRELIALKPDVVMTSGTQQLAALQRATKTIPVVFAQVSDPVGGRFVASIAHPGANITGFTDFEYSFSAKWLELLKEIAPGVKRAAVLFDVNNQNSGKFLPHIEAAGPRLGVTVSRAPLRNGNDVEPALNALPAGPDGGLIVLPNTIVILARDQIIAAAAGRRLPAVYPYASFARVGGLVAYGVDTLDMYRGAASYVDRILKGEKPADLPIQFATRFEFVVNLKTAKATGLTIPTSALLRASELIE